MLQNNLKVKIVIVENKVEWFLKGIWNIASNSYLIGKWFIFKKISIINLDVKNIEKLKNRYNSKTSLDNIVPSIKVKIECEKIVDAIQLFIEEKIGRAHVWTPVTR